MFHQCAVEVVLIQPWWCFVACGVGRGGLEWRSDDVAAYHAVHSVFWTWTTHWTRMLTTILVQCVARSVQSNSPMVMSPSARRTIPAATRLKLFADAR
jgi:hypothetical protein